MSARPPGMRDGEGTRLTVYLAESDRAGRQPLYSEIVRRARAEGLASVTVLRGMEGFGASSSVNAAHILSLSDLPVVVEIVDLPVVIEIIDRTDRVEAFLPILDELVTEGLVVREDVVIHRYVERPAPGG